jgi:hypothetical protein
VILRYFAYGSNMHPSWLRERAPSSEPAGMAVLDAHALRFHKRSADGSAKCDIMPADGGRVYGVVFRVHPNDLARLDAAERGYDRATVHVFDGTGDLTAFTYRARPDRVVAGLKPFHWYRDLIVLGARHHGLPADYVAAIEAVPARDDPDAVRAAAMEALLARLRESTP